MADTLESIYLNTSIGGTELDDGEHTILTTNATTRYVLKDAYVSDPSSALSNTYLELNGFNVGSLTSNLSGSLIIPPNSTLKIKSTDYPYNFYQNIEYALNSGDILYKESYEDKLGNAVGNTVEVYKAGANSVTEITDMVRTTTTSNGNQYLIYSTSDNNSVQSLRRIRTTTGSITAITSRNYDPFMFDDSKVYSFQNNTSLEFTDLTTSLSAPSTNFNSTNVPSLAGAAYPTTHGNYYTPHTTSSYPRGRGAHGFVWYVPSSGYSNHIYAINLTNGAFHLFNITGQTPTMTSNNCNFVPSIDYANDALYLWTQPNNQAQIIRSKFDNWSSIVALDNSTQPNSHSGTTTIHSLPTNSYTGTSMSRSIMGYDPNGGFTFFSTSQVRYHMDNSVNETDQVNSLTADGQTFTNPNTGFVQKQFKLTDAQASALSLSAPTFGVQLLGIKSEA